MSWGLQFGGLPACLHKFCLYAEEVGIGNARMPGIAALGMPRGPALLYNADFECQGIWHWECQNAWHCSTKGMFECQGGWHWE